MKEREEGGKSEFFFQIISADSFIIRLDWFLNNSVTSNYPVRSGKRYLKREISVSYYLFYIFIFLFRLYQLKIYFDLISLNKF